MMEPQTINATTQEVIFVHRLILLEHIALARQSLGLGIRWGPLSWSGTRKASFNRTENRVSSNCEDQWITSSNKPSWSQAPLGLTTWSATPAPGSSSVFSSYCQLSVVIHHAGCTVHSHLCPYSSATNSFSWKPCKCFFASPRFR